MARALVVAGLLVAAASYGSAARAGEVAAPAEYAKFGGARRVTIQGYEGDAMEPFITRDGRYLLFNNRNDPPGRTDLFYAERVDDLTFTFRGAIVGANSPSLDGVPSLDDAGELYFVSTRSYDATRSTIYRARFHDGRTDPPAPVAGVSLGQPWMVQFDAEISEDGQTLYFADGDFHGGHGPRTARIVVADRRGEAFARRPDSDRLLAEVNRDGLNYAPDISADGLELFFTRVAPIGGGEAPRIYRAHRASADAPFEPPQRVTAAIGLVEAPSLSKDGRRLYFHRLEGGRYVLFMAER